MPNQIIVFISCRGYRTVGKIFSICGLSCKEEKNANIQIMKTDSRYKDHKWCDITKIRHMCKFVKFACLLISLNH